MKKFLMVIMLLLIQITNVYANCEGKDGCKDCAGEAQTECMKSNEYKVYVCKQGCVNVKDQTGYNTCITKCEESPESGSSIFSGSNGSSINSGNSQGSNSSAEYTETVETQADEKKLAENCDTLIGTSTETGKMIHDIYNILKFAIPIILLALSIKDFGSAIISQNDLDMKKAMISFAKRLIIALVILVLPTILNFILNNLLGVETCFL